MAKGSVGGQLFFNDNTVDRGPRGDSSQGVHGLIVRTPWVWAKKQVTLTLGADDNVIVVLTSRRPTSDDRPVFVMTTRPRVRQRISVMRDGAPSSPTACAQTTGRSQTDTCRARGKVPRNSARRVAERQAHPGRTLHYALFTTRS